VKQRHFRELEQNLASLLENGHSQVAQKILQQAFDSCDTFQDAREYLSVLDGLPQRFLQQPEYSKIYLQTLCRAREPRRILEWTRSVNISSAERVYLAWALLREQKHAQALEVLQQAQPATDLDWAIFYRTKGEALLHQGHPDWQKVFEQARAYLGGAALGRMLLDLGAFLHFKGDRSAARVAWAEAISHLEDDPYYLAWAHDSLGYSMLQENPRLAENHLLKSLQLSAKSTAKAFRSRALAGLGAVRRSLGEWQRALDSYQRAFRCAQEDEDRVLALWGWALVLRLISRPEEALAKLLQAQRIGFAAEWLELDIAATRLMMGDSLAQDDLEALAAKASSERPRMLLQVLKAELFRRLGRFEEARRLLAGLGAHPLWVREELQCFPELGQLARCGSLAQPRNRVRVRPFGRLTVWVNGRLVPLSPVSKAGELLVYLLVKGREVGVEAIIEDLASPKSKNPRKALWENAEKLRQALGWKESLQAYRGVYALDPQAEWDFEQQPPVDVLDPAQTFMAGYYSNWVEEYRQQFLVV